MPSSGFDEQVKNVTELKKLMAVKPPGKVNLDACATLLAKLKLALTQYAFLPSGESASKKELLLARETLELGAQWSIKKGDVAAFERYIAQLKVYYFDFSGSMPESVFLHELLGLNLLCLLSSNRIAEFHMELERLDPALLHENLYIRHPVMLEQYLMEGSYNKIFLARGNVPAETYTFFVDELVNTIREKIAEGFESAYANLAVGEAARLLFLDDKDHVEALATERNWVKVEDRFEFPTSGDEVAKLPSNELIQRSLHYAREMEKIV